MRMPQYVASPLLPHLEQIREQIVMLPETERRQLMQAVNRDTLRRNDVNHRANAERAERDMRRPRIDSRQMALLEGAA